MRRQDRGACIYPSRRLWDARPGCAHAGPRDAAGCAELAGRRGCGRVRGPRCPGRAGERRPARASLTGSCPRVLQGRRSPAGITAARAVSSLAEPEFVSALLVARPSPRGRRGRWWAALAPCMVVPAGAIARRRLSRVIRRARPPESGWLAEPEGFSLPSKHTTLAALTAGALISTPRWLPGRAGSPAADGRRGRGKPGLPGRALAHRRSGWLVVRRGLAAAGRRGGRDDCPGHGTSAELPQAAALPQVPVHRGDLLDDEPVKFPDARGTAMLRPAHHLPGLP